jgi:hypothetical protein
MKRLQNLIHHKSIIRLMDILCQANNIDNNLSFFTISNIKYFPAIKIIKVEIVNNFKFQQLHLIYVKSNNQIKKDS